MTDTLTYSPPMAETQRWMTRAEAADHLRVTTRTVDAYVRTGRLRKYTLADSRTPRFRFEDVNALVKAGER